MRSLLLWSLLAGWLPLAALAAEPAPIQPNPADPAAAAVPLTYRSAFSTELRPQQPPRGDWRQANDRVRAVGGFAGALKDEAPATPPQHQHGEKQPDGHRHTMPGHTMPGHKMPDHKMSEKCKPERCMQMRGMPKQGQPQDGKKHDRHHQHGGDKP